MTKEEALAELATVNAAITEYYQGKRRTSLIVWSAGIKRQYDFADPAKLFEHLKARRAELQNFLAGLESVPVQACAFTRGTNIPMRFVREY
jgi:hypothetical protein